jgi:hypothetical protein
LNLETREGEDFEEKSSGDAFWKRKKEMKLPGASKNPNPITETTVWTIAISGVTWVELKNLPTIEMSEDLKSNADNC